MAGPSRQRSMFNPRPVHFEFVVNKVGLGHGCHVMLRLSTVRIIPPMLHIHISLIYCWLCAVLAVDSKQCCLFAICVHHFIKTCSFYAVFCTFLILAFAVFIRFHKIWLCSFSLISFGFWDVEQIWPPAAGDYVSRTCIQGKHTGWGCSRMRCWGKYSVLSGGTWQQSGENCVMKSFVICITHQILFGWSNEGGRDLQGMWHAWMRRDTGFWWGNLK
jgi:hypothetical protein